MTTSRYGRAATLSGWLIAAFYSVHTALAVVMPRSEKTSLLREELRSWHYLLGLCLFALLIWRLWIWFRDRPAPARAAGMTAAGHAWARQLALTAYVVLALMPLFGIVQAWSEGLTVRLGPFLTLPALVSESHTAWMFAGYFHSALGFGVTLLFLVAALTGAWFVIRRGVGLVRAFPPGFGVQAWVAVLVTVYAFTTFTSPDPGIPAVIACVVLSLLVWGLGTWLARRRRDGFAAGMPGGEAGTGVRVAAAIGALVPVALAAYGPYAMFRVTPWPMGEVVEVAGGVTSHAGPVVEVTVEAETAFERQVNDQTYKWCRFCHTVEKGGKHLVGPNLYAIFGQQAGTVPNFHYSPAMAEAGRKGLVWTDETLDAFLADPRGFLPGTTMIISSGPVKTAEERAAVINILKRETMPEQDRR